MKRRILSTFLAVVMVFSLLPAYALAEDEDVIIEDIAGEESEEPPAEEEPAPLADPEPDPEPEDPPVGEGLAPPAEPGPESEPEEASPEEEAPVVFCPEPVLSGPVEGNTDGDALLTAYAKQMLDEPLGGTFGAEYIKNAGKALTGVNRELYTRMRAEIADIAAGRRNDTEFAYTLEELGIYEACWTEAELGVPFWTEDDYLNEDAYWAALDMLGYDPYAVVDALLVDCPFELYWFDKTHGYSYGFPRLTFTEKNGQEALELFGGFDFSFYVAEEYALGSFETDPAAGTTVTTAVETAAAIVARNAGKGDYDKLLAYKNTICDLTDYNHPAAQDDTTPYGNPWQLIWVFDGDPATKVVCEGYSKAFQYLCDLSSFEHAVTAFSVTGYMAASGGGGGHMWNVVTMENGKNYLVDTTNCDGGSSGHSNSLFLVGYKSGSARDGYTVSYFKYYYDNEMFAVFGEDSLTLSSKSYLNDDHTIDTEMDMRIVLEAGGTYRLAEELTLTGDLEIPYGAELILFDPEAGAAGRLIVPDGVTVHNGGAISAEDGGSIAVLAGGSLVNDGTIVCSLGAIEGGLDPAGTGRVVYTARLPADGDQAALQALLEAGCTQVTVQGDLAIDRDFTLQEGRAIVILPGASLTVAEGAAFTNRGDLSVSGGLALVRGAFDNAASGSVGVYAGGRFIVTGSFTGGEVDLYSGTVKGAPYVYAGDGQDPVIVGFTWDLTESGTAVITGWSGAIPAELVIPGTIDGVTVTAIGEEAFPGSAGLVSVTIPESVTSVGAWAFSNCGDLAAVYYGGTRVQWALVEIAEEGNAPLLAAALHCAAIDMGECGADGAEVRWKLTEDGVLTISGAGAMADYTFEEPAPWEKYRAEILTVVIEPGVTGIGDFAFHDLSGITGVSIPDTVTSIGEEAFCGCICLAEVDIPDSVVSIGDRAFAYCRALTEIVIPEGVTGIGEKAFEGCSALTQIVLPQSLEELGDGAFSGCTALEEVIVPDAANVPGAIDDYDWDADGFDGSPVTGAITAPKELLNASLLSGGKLQLTAESLFGAVSWSAGAEDSQYASVSAAGLVTAKTVTEAHVVTVTASAAGGAYTLDFHIRVYPKAQSVAIAADDGLATGQTRAFDMNSGLTEMTFFAAVLSADADQTVKWTLTDKNKKKVAAITDNGDGSVTVRPNGTGNTGTVTLTATAQDGSKKKASVKVSFVRYAQETDKLEISGLPVGDDGIMYMTGGDSKPLKTNIGGIAALTNRTLVWELVGDSRYLATISSGGKLSASTVPEPTLITVHVYAKANPAAEATADIRLLPKESLAGRTQRIKLFRNGEIINNTTQILDTGTDGNTLSVTAEAIGDEAGKGVSWKSSNKKIAAVDANGLITAKKAGTVTITVTAKDGTGVKASFKLTVRSCVHSVAIREGDFELRGGTKKTLHADFNAGGAAPTNKKVTWSLGAADTAYASISQKGVLTAKKITGAHDIRVTVTSQEDPAVSASVTVRLYPSVSEVWAFWKGEHVTTIKLTLAEAQAGIDLDAVCRPTGAKDGVNWKSGSTKIAAVDGNGVVTVKKKGTVKITATATDGSKKKVTVTIKIV